MKKNILAAVCLMFLLTGCRSTIKSLTGSAAGKNLDFSGYVMLSEAEAANSENAMPQGRMIIGRVTYKSRKVSIPADTKVPTAAYFKAMTTETFFGTRESAIEYDFTAATASEAAVLSEAMHKYLEKSAQILPVP